VDNTSKKNAYTPAMRDRLAELLTEYEDNDDLWVAIFCSVGEHTTAGLDMPRFFGPTAEPDRRKPGLVDPFGLQRRCTRPVIAVVQGTPTRSASRWLWATTSSSRRTPPASSNWNRAVASRRWAARISAI